MDKDKAFSKTEYKYYGVPRKQEILDTLFVSSDWIVKAKEHKMVWTEEYWNKIKPTLNLDEISIKKIRVWKKVKDLKDILYAPTESHRYWHFDKPESEYTLRMNGIPELEMERIYG